MKIAIHQPRASYFLAGAEAISIETAKLLSTNNRVDFVSSDNNFTTQFKRLVDSNVRIKLFDNKAYKSTNNFDISNKEMNEFDLESVLFGEKTSGFYRKENFDIVAAHYSTDILTLGTSSPILLHLHGFPMNLRKIDIKSYKKADFYVFCSEFTKEKNFEMFGELPNSTVFYMCPDTENYRPLNIEKDVDIFYVGRLTKRKGVDQLLIALSKCHNFSKVLIAGHGPEEAKIKSMIKTLNLNKSVSFIGSINSEKVLNLMNRTKLFVHPTTEREPFPTTVLEALSCATPVISTQVGGIPEIIDNGKNGELIEPNNPELLARTIDRLLQDESTRTDYAKAGYALIKRDFNRDKKLREIERIYKRAANENEKNLY